MEKTITSNYKYEELCKVLASVPLLPKTRKNITFAGILLIFGVLTTLFSKIDEDLNDLFAAGLFIVCCSIFLLLIYILNIPGIKGKVFYKSTLKNNLQFKGGATFAYTFLDEQIQIVTTANNLNANATIKYSDLTKVLASQDTIYFFVNVSNVYVCKREFFNNHELNQIKDKLSKKANKHFIVC